MARLLVVIIVAAMFATSCSKSKAENEAGSEIKDHPIYTIDSTSIGTITISEAAAGEARVTIHLNPAVLTPFRAPYQPMLENSEPLAYLNIIDPATGISETSPVVSTNKNLTVSYDLLMYTRDLKLRIEDADRKLIAVTKLR